MAKDGPQKVLLNSTGVPSFPEVTNSRRATMAGRKRWRKAGISRALERCAA